MKTSIAVVVAVGAMLVLANPIAVSQILSTFYNYIYWGHLKTGGDVAGLAKRYGHESFWSSDAAEAAVKEKRYGHESFWSSDDAEAAVKEKWFNQNF